MRFPWRKDVCRRGRRSSSALCLREIGARSLSRSADLRPRGAVFAGASPRVVGVGAFQFEEIVDVGVHLAGEPADGFEAMHIAAPALRVVEVVREGAMNH